MVLETGFTRALKNPVCTTSQNKDMFQELLLVGVNNKTVGIAINIEQCLRKSIENDNFTICNWYFDDRLSISIPGKTIYDGKLLTLNGVPTMFGGIGEQGEYLSSVWQYVRNNVNVRAEHFWSKLPDMASSRSGHSVIAIPECFMCQTCTSKV